MAGFFDRAREAMRSFRSPNTKGYGGGIHNSLSGQGGSSDKSASAFFTPTRFYWRSPLEILYVQSWAARKMVEIPVNDGFLRWREWADGDMEGAADSMRDAEMRHQVRQRLNQGLRAASAFGTALVVPITREAPLTEPLMVNRIRPGDLVSLQVFDRFDISIVDRDRDPMSPTFRQPMNYRITPSNYGGTPFTVHASRCMRLDGISPLTGAGFEMYDYDFGISEFVPALVSLMNDQTFASAVGHLGQEASVPVLGIDSLGDKASGVPAPGEESVEQIGRRFADSKSIYRVAMIDRSSEEFHRVAVQFSGIANIMDRFAARVAAAADIPQTRFFGQAPAGLNSTGEGDERGYALMAEAKRDSRLFPILPVLDMILSRDAGLPEVPEWTWPSLLEMSEMERAEAALKLAQAMKEVVLLNVMTEDEARARLDGHPVFGDLPEMDFPSGDPDLE